MPFHRENKGVAGVFHRPVESINRTYTELVKTSRPLDSARGLVGLGLRGAVVTAWGTSGDQTHFSRRSRRRTRPPVWGGRMDQMVCKPGSVYARPSRRKDEPETAIPLDRPSRDGSRDLPGPSRPVTAYPTRGRRGVPIRSCSRRGLPCRPCCQVRGGLLPHPFTLPAPKGGGLLSVALSLGSLPAGVTRRLVTVEPGLSSTFLRRPRPPDHLVRGLCDGLIAPGQLEISR